MDNDTDASDLESVTSTDSDYSSEAETRIEGRKVHVPRIATFLQHASEQIRSLFELSSVLRRPTIDGKWIRSAAKRDNDSSGALELSNAYANYDLLHISEKVHCLRGQGKDVVSLLFQEEAAGSTVGLMEEHIQDVSWLCHRLAKANGRRRKQLHYWLRHPYGAPLTKAPSSPEKPSDSKSVVSKQPAKSTKTGSDASTLKRPTSTASTQKRSLPTVTSSYSFSTAAASDTRDDTMESRRPRTVYAPTISGRRYSNRVPDAPTCPDGDQWLFCPYCGMQLEDEVIKKRDYWK